MPEPRRGQGLAWLLAGMALAAGTWFDVGSAGPLAWLAQAPAAIGIALLHGSASPGRPWRDLGELALAWGLAFIAVAALAWLPLRALVAGPGLGAVLALSGVAAVALLVT